MRNGDSPSPYLNSIRASGTRDWVSFYTFPPTLTWIFFNWRMQWSEEGDAARAVADIQAQAFFNAWIWIGAVIWFDADFMFYRLKVRVEEINFTHFPLSRFMGMYSIMQQLVWGQASVIIAHQVGAEKRFPRRRKLPSV
jgi:hypothetical protein